MCILYKTFYMQHYAMLSSCKALFSFLPRKREKNLLKGNGMHALNSRGELHVVQERPPLSREGEATVSQDRFSFPVPLTSFVGREQEIVTVCELLRRPEIRLLTLMGTGGVGKTRLALQVATHLSKDIADQACFISLMDTSDPALVLPTIAK